MSGQILLSSFSAERRAAVWERCRQEAGAFALVVPSTTQVGLLQRSFPNLGATFGAVADLDRLATRLLAEHAPGTYLVSEAELFGLVGEVRPGDTSLELNRIVMQLSAWQAAGVLSAQTLPARSVAADPVAADVFARIETLLATRLSGATLQTTAWAKAQLAAILRTDAPLALPKLLLEGFIELGPIDRALVTALASRATVLVRHYHLSHGGYGDAHNDPIVRALSEGDAWSILEDASPNGPERYTLERKQIAIGHFPTIGKQLLAVVERSAQLWAEGASRSNTLLALPDSPAVRVIAERLLADLDAPLRWSMPRVPGAGRVESHVRQALELSRPPCTASGALAPFLEDRSAAGDRAAFGRLTTVSQTLFGSRALAGDAPLPWRARLGQLLGLLACPQSPELGGSFAEGKLDIVAHQDVLGRASATTLFVVDTDGQSYPDWHGGAGPLASALPSYLIPACKAATTLWLATGDALRRDVTDRFADRVPTKIWHEAV